MWPWKKEEGVDKEGEERRSKAQIMQLDSGMAARPSCGLPRTAEPSPAKLLWPSIPEMERGKTRLEAGLVSKDANQLFALIDLISHTPD